MKEWIDRQKDRCMDKDKDGWIDWIHLRVDELENDYSLILVE